MHGRPSRRATSTSRSEFDEVSTRRRARRRSSAATARTACWRFVRRVADVVRLRARAARGSGAQHVHDLVRLVDGERRLRQEGDALRVGRDRAPDLLDVLRRSGSRRRLALRSLDLLVAVVPDEEDRVPRAANRRASAWTLPTSGHVASITSSRLAVACASPPATRRAPRRRRSPRPAPRRAPRRRPRRAARGRRRRVVVDDLLAT